MANENIVNSIAIRNKFRLNYKTPIIIFGYFNPFLQYGLKKVMQDIKKVGAEGVLIVDLPPEEAFETQQAANHAELELVYLLAPTSTQERIDLVSRLSNSFIYLVSVTGVTGVREKIDKNLRNIIAKIKKKTKISKTKKRKEKVVSKKSIRQSTYKSSTFKTNEEKIKIKKIEKQPTEKKIYNIKDYVVYPKHGVGKIVSIEKAKIGSIDITFYKVFIEKEKLTLSIPLNQQSHLRRISSINQINKAINILKSKPKIKRTMWSRRAQEYEQKINSGKLYQLAEVVKDLNKKTDIIVEQSYSERLLFEKAYERIKSEFEIILGEKGKIKIDKALKRLEDPTQIQGSKQKNAPLN